jgi:alkaline phosphatase
VPDATSAELDTIVNNPEDAINNFGHITSYRAHIGWSTHGHSAIDVNIYSSGGPGAEAIRGNVENTEVGKFLRGYLDVDVEEITKELKGKLNLRNLGAMDMPGSASQFLQTVAVESEDHWMRQKYSNFA